MMEILPNVSQSQLYRMHERWIHQPWYDPNSVFKLIKINEFRIHNFGVDCIWENVITGFRLNHWDNTMRELTKEELREFNLSNLLN